MINKTKIFKFLSVFFNFGLDFFRLAEDFQFSAENSKSAGGRLMIKLTI